MPLPLPSGTEETGRTVRVTVERIDTTTPPPDAWRDEVAALAGSWEGVLERAPQGECEERESIP